MTENLRNFLEAVSKDEELSAKINAMDKEAIISVAKTLGIELTEADFVQEVELGDNDLDAVAGGKDCVCVLGGGGEGGGEWNNKTCACVIGGGGQTCDSNPRCVCAINGWGAD